MLRLSILAATALATTVAGADAHSIKRYDADRHRALLAERIEIGRQSGAITFFEGLRLRRELMRIDIEKSQLAADGRLTARDKAKLKSSLDAADMRIAAEATDLQRRWYVLPRVGR